MTTDYLRQRIAKIAEACELLYLAADNDPATAEDAFIQAEDILHDAHSDIASLGDPLPDSTGRLEATPNNAYPQP